MAVASTLSIYGRKHTKPLAQSAVENLRNLCDKPSFVAPLNAELQTWQDNLKNEDRRYMSLTIFKAMVFIKQTTVTEAAELSAMVMDLTAETVRRWAHNYYCQATNEDVSVVLQQSQRGQHSKQNSLIDTCEELRHDAQCYVREMS